MDHLDGAGVSTPVGVHYEFEQCLTDDPAFPRYLGVYHRIDGLQDRLAIDTVGREDAAVARSNRRRACPEIQRKHDRRPHG